jgi:Lrp/AsnC family leucine-responsive transcriptional regulator
MTRQCASARTNLADLPAILQQFACMDALDDADRAILTCLRQNGRATVAELAAATGLSASACSRRLRRLEDRRVIRGYKAIIDPDADGRGLTAFVAVRLVRHQREHIQRFQAGARKVPEILECHHVTGTFDYLLRVEVSDLAAYERFHADQLAALHNVGQVVTYISMTDFSDA